MFYLKEFLKSIGESPFRGASFLVFSCLLCLSLTHRPWIKKTIQKITPERMVNPYFVAVLDGSVDVVKFKNLIEKLPGIISVDDKESDRSRIKISQLVNQLGQDYALSQDLMNFNSLRVILSHSLSHESLDFVRQQVIKMGGKEHVSSSDVKYPEVTNLMKTHPFYVFLGKSGDWGIVVILAVLWMISYWLCYDVFRSRSYLIEKFQRKKLVAAKSIATGLILVFVCFNALGIWNGTLKFFDSVILLMIFSSFWTFSLKEWRWKPVL
jgi:predicted small integral membrane protein